MSVGIKRAEITALQSTDTAKRPTNLAAGDVQQSSQILASAFQH